MATTNPAQQMADDIRALQSRVGDLQDRVRLNDALGAVSDLNTTVTGLPQRIAALRTRGYVFEKDMEPQAQAMIASWALLYPNLQTQINQQTAMLIGSLRPI
jgi:CHAD domain-containing protein